MRGRVHLLNVLLVACSKLLFNLSDHLLTSSDSITGWRTFKAFVLKRKPEDTQCHFQRYRKLKDLLVWWLEASIGKEMASFFQSNP
jgi:hypothetical protein